MASEPTPDGIRALSAALAEARLLDDRFGNADPRRVLAWAQVLADSQFSDQDLIAGVRGFYAANTAGRVMLVGDLALYARQARRERTESEPDSYREARQNALDAKAAEDRIDALAGHAFTPPADLPQAPARPSQRHDGNPLSRPCPHCKAHAMKPCVVPGSGSRRRPDGGVHQARIDGQVHTWPTVTPVDLWRRTGTDT